MTLGHRPVYLKLSGKEKNGGRKCITLDRLRSRLALAIIETEIPIDIRRPSLRQLLNQHNLDVVSANLNPRFKRHLMLRLVKVTFLKDVHQTSGGV